MPPAAAKEKEGSELGALGGGAPQTPAEGTASPLHSPAIDGLAVLSGLRWTGSGTQARALSLFSCYCRSG